MDEKLERLSSSVVDKVQEAEQLCLQGDDIQQQIDVIRQRGGGSSPTKLSYLNLRVASLQGTDLAADSCMPLFKSTVFYHELS